MDHFPKLKSGVAEYLKKWRETNRWLWFRMVRIVLIYLVKAETFFFFLCKLVKPIKWGVAWGILSFDPRFCCSTIKGVPTSMMTISNKLIVSIDRIKTKHARMYINDELIFNVHLDDRWNWCLTHIWWPQGPVFSNL